MRSIRKSSHDIAFDKKSGVILNYISISVNHHPSNVFHMQALLFRWLLEYVRSDDENIVYGLALSACLFASDFGKTLSFMAMIILNFLMGINYYWIKFNVHTSSVYYLNDML